MKGDEDVLWHQSGINRHGEPFVQLIRGETVIAQMSVEQAREHARAIQEAAEASEQDAFMVNFFREHIGVTEEEAMRILMAYRNYRVAGFVMDQMDAEAGTLYIAGIALRMRALIRGDAQVYIATD